jgi:EAL domain-containing protein (putative c-di-GMP-specific phosphodiesterase class I)
VEFESVERRTTIAELVKALNHDRFVLYRQGIQRVAASDGAPWQEILIRFRDEDDTLLPPGTFFQVLERWHLLSALDRWVVNRLFRWLLAKGRDASWLLPRSTLNLSSESLASDDFSSYVSGQLSKGGVPGGCIAFEIPEADAILHAVALEKLVRELRPLGCSFFVSGYLGRHLSTHMLQAIGVDGVKLHGRIVQHAHEEAEAFDEARLIIKACRTRGLTSIAEFVELPETLQLFIGLGVDYVQGWGVSPVEPLV